MTTRNYFTSTDDVSGGDYMDDMAEKGELIINNMLLVPTSITNSGNAYTITIDPPLLAGQDVSAGMAFWIKPNATNTGAVTMRITSDNPYYEVCLADETVIKSGEFDTSTLYLIVFIDGKFKILNSTAASGGDIDPVLPEDTEWVDKSSSSSINLTVDDGYKIRGSLTAENKSINLPDATTLAPSPIYVIVNTGSIPFNINTFDGRVVGRLIAGGSIEVALVDNSTSAGAWDVLSVSNADELIIGQPLTAIGFSPTWPTSGRGGYCMLSSTKAILVYANGTSVRCRVLTKSDNVWGVGSEVTIGTQTDISNYISTVRASDTHAVVSFPTAATTLSSYVIDCSTTLAVAGSAQTFTISSGTGDDVFTREIVGNTSRFVVLYRSGASATSMAVATVNTSAKTISFGSGTAIGSGCNTFQILNPERVFYSFLSGAAVYFGLAQINSSSISVLSFTDSDVGTNNTRLLLMNRERKLLKSVLQSTTTLYVTTFGTPTDMATPQSIFFGGRTLSGGDTYSINAGSRNINDYITVAGDDMFMNDVNPTHAPAGGQYYQITHKIVTSTEREILMRGRVDSSMITYIVNKVGRVT